MHRALLRASRLPATLARTRSLAPYVPSPRTLSNDTQVVRGEETTGGGGRYAANVGKRRRRGFGRGTSSIEAAAAAWLLLGFSIASGAAPDFDALGRETVTRLQEYLRVDTTNPPGNESRAVDFFARILKAEGISYQTAESAPGRGNIWARIPGGSKPGLILLNHTDVVPVDEAFWSVPPFSGAVRDGYIYGRGALDMKSLAILQLQAFLALHRMKTPRNRDVIFIATADEEAGARYGAGWLVEHRPESFRGAGLLLNEGASGIVVNKRTVFCVEITQKVPVWIRLTATGKPGHGSAPGPESAVTRLIAALGKLQAHSFPPRITPAVDSFFKAIGPYAADELQGPFRDMPKAMQDAEFISKLQRSDPYLHALLRNTVSITRLEGSNKINVIPAKATAELDCRLLPDQDAGEFVEALRRAIDDPSIAIERLVQFKPSESPTDTELYRSIARVCRRSFPDTPVVSSVAAGFTDSHFFRSRGIVSYGFSPVIVPREDMGGVHGNDERISVENMVRGARLMFEVLADLCLEGS